MGAWVHGCMGAWVHGCMGAWVHGLSVQARPAHPAKSLGQGLRGRAAPRSSSLRWLGGAVCGAPRGRGSGLGFRV